MAKPIIGSTLAPDSANIQSARLEPAEQRWSVASGRGIGVKRWLELMPRPEVTAHPYLADSVRIDISEITLNLGLVLCNIYKFG